MPLSRLSVADVARHAQRTGLVARISDSTVWRCLHEDAIRPWQHRCWIFPRDPGFQAKATRILDLYARCWQGQPLRKDEFVISTDEKTSIQARLRVHPSLPVRPGEAMRVEHEYARGGAWAYLAALDVHRAKVFGRCEATTGIAPFERLVDHVMSQWPYSQARRVFWIMDNGSSHRGEACVRRLTQAHPRLVPVHAPVHASWLNQIEIVAAGVRRKDSSVSEPFHLRLRALQECLRNNVVGGLVSFLNQLAAQVAGAGHQSVSGLHRRTHASVLPCFRIEGPFNPRRGISTSCMTGSRRSWCSSSSWGRACRSVGLGLAAGTCRPVLPT